MFAKLSVRKISVRKIICVFLGGITCPGIFYSEAYKCVHVNVKSEFSCIDG
jgi:hypothetical protein